MPPDIAPVSIAALIVVTAGAVHDIRTTRIPNWLTFPSAALALAMHFFASGGQGVLWALAGWLTGCLVSLVFKMAPVWLKVYKAPPVGFGDTKLIAAAGAFLGPQLILVAYYYFCIFYALPWLLKAFTTINWWRLLCALRAPVLPGQSLLTKEEVKRVSDFGKKKIAIGPAIAAGTYMAVFLGKQTLSLLGFN